MNIEKEFVPYELAVELKQLGFDEPCLTYYFSNGDLNDASEEDYTLFPGDPRFYSDTNSSLMQYAEGELKNNAISAPLFQQAFRWFREKHGLSGWVNEAYSGSPRSAVISIKSEKGLDYLSSQMIVGYHETYEEAELASLKKLIEIVKNR